jgi:hypothetical protein
MARKKKTFDVLSFKDYVNIQLARTDEFATDEFKSGLCIALHEVLHKTGNYNGFQYLYWAEKGWQDWYNSGQTEVWSEKKVFIYGTPDSKYRGSEYARKYY